MGMRSVEETLRSGSRAVSDALPPTITSWKIGRGFIKKVFATMDDHPLFRAGRGLLIFALPAAVISVGIMLVTRAVMGQLKLAVR